MLPPPALICYLTAVQYAYSILSIISGFFALVVTVFITFITGFISLARLDLQKIPMPLISKFLEPSREAFNAALMVDHDNTNPIKFMALEWFCDRMKELRKVEVRQQALLPLCLCVHPLPRCVVVSPYMFATMRVTLQCFVTIIIK